MVFSAFMNIIIGLKSGLHGVCNSASSVVQLIIIGVSKMSGNVLGVISL